MASDEESRASARSKRKGRALQGGLLGLGFDARDGHQRITRGDDFVLYGGSPETHERMTDIVLRMKERLKTQGKSFRQISTREFEDLGRDCFRAK
jgi:hypothetical protein